MEHSILDAEDNDVQYLF